MDSHKVRAFNPLIGLFILAVASPPCFGEARADTVILRTGEIFSGTILRANREEVSIQLDSGGVMSFRSQRVERVVKRGSVIQYNQSPVKGPAKKAEPAEGEGEGLPLTTVRPPPSELSGFPLHAEKPDSAGAPKAAEQMPSRFTDPAEGYSLTTPPGFRSWNSDLPLVQRAFRQPGVLANLTIAFHETEENLEAIKNDILKLLSRRGNVKLIRQLPQAVSGARNGEGWLLEMDDSSGTVSVRQLQLLTKKGRKFYAITYSAAANHFPRLVPGFEASARSFRFEPRAGGAAEPEQDEIPPEIQAYLRKQPIVKPPP
jgi:hypothetical protein